MLYQQVDLSTIPGNLRRKVLRQKITRLSPFQETGHYEFLDGEHAMVWIWDETLRKAAIDDVKARYSALSDHFDNLDVLPEAALLERRDDGVHKQVCVVGEDVQTWRSGDLVSSLWSEAQGEQVPLKRECAEPWTEVQPAVLWRNESFWWRSGLLLLCLVLVFQIGHLSGWLFHNSRLAEQLNEGRVKFSGAVSLRNEARESLRTNEELRRFSPRYTQLSLLADFDELMPPEIEISEWDFHDDQLAVTVAAESLDNSSYIERLAAGDFFKEVRVLPGTAAGTAVITMEIAE